MYPGVPGSVSEISRPAGPIQVWTTRVPPARRTPDDETNLCRYRGNNNRLCRHALLRLTGGPRCYPHREYYTSRIPAYRPAALDLWEIAVEGTGVENESAVLRRLEVDLAGDGAVRVIWLFFYGVGDGEQHAYEAMLEFSSDTNHGDASHDNARRIYRQRNSEVQLQSPGDSILSLLFSL